MDQDSCTNALSSSRVSCRVTVCESLSDHPLERSATGDSEPLASLSLQSESVRDGDGARLTSLARELLESVRGGSEVKLTRLSSCPRERDLLAGANGFSGISGEGLLRWVTGFVPTKEEVVDISRFPEDCLRGKKKTE